MPNSGIVVQAFAEPIGRHIFRLLDEGMLGYFNGVPTASVAGYGKGAIAIDYANGNWYRNTGSKTSATWTLQTGTITTQTITNLTATSETITTSNMTTLVGSGHLGTSSSLGLGYDAGAGGSVTQATNRSTSVTLNKICGQITTDTTSLAAEAGASFKVANSAVIATDVVTVCQATAGNGGNTAVGVTGVGAGAFTIQVSNNNAAAGTAETGAIVINFAVVKSVIT